MSSNRDEDITRVIPGKLRYNNKPRRRAADVIKRIPEVRDALSTIAQVRFDLLNREDQYSLLLYLNRIADVLRDITAAAALAQKGGRMT